LRQEESEIFLLKQF